MTEKETTSGGALWRKRAVATVGVAAAVAAGSVALASSADAAVVPVTATLTAPATVLNNNATTMGQNLVLEVKNTDPAATVGGTAALNVTKPAGLVCTNIHVGAATVTPGTDVVVAPVFTTLSGDTAGTTCTSGAQNFSQPGNSDDTYTFPLTVQGTGVSGSLGFSVTIVQTVTGGNGNTATTTTNTATSTLSAPPANAAPTFVATVPPVPVVYKQYSFQLTANQGVPTPTYTGFGAPALPDPTTKRYGNAVTADSATITVGTGTAAEDHAALDLFNGYYFDEVTGKIVFNTTDDANGNDNINAVVAPIYQWTIIANNQQGGATTASNGTIAGVNQPTPNVAVHDVDSPKFTSARLFSDVGFPSTFSTAIYSLVTNGTITGYLDGTFRPGTGVSRQAFAHFLYTSTFRTSNNEENDGPCTTFQPSAFPDVPNNSQFCTSIRVLSSLDIVNGYSDGKFHPTGSITRQALAAFLYRSKQVQTTGASGSDATCTTPTGYNDVTTSNPFCGDIEYLTQQGIVKGYSDGGYHPGAVSSRQAVAQLLYSSLPGNAQNQNVRRALAAAK